MRPNRLYSQKNQKSQLNKSHIIEAHLDRKNQLISKYQTETNDLMEQIQSKEPSRRANTILSTNKAVRKRALSSVRSQVGDIEGPAVGGSLKDYNKLILGLEYALEAERKKNEEMTQKNQSLQSQISNLRNLLMGPDEQKHYQKTAYKESQDKITYLQNRIIEQKKNYQFIIDSKNESMITLQLQLKTLKKSFQDKSSNNDQALSRRVLDLTSQIQQLSAVITKKNIIIERLKYQNIPDQDSDDEEVTKIKKAQKNKFYLEQLDISNKLIMRKNVEILGLSNKVMSYEKILDVVELYLDKKEVRGVDLAILQHPCVNKLRMLLREKAVFEKQLLNQLNDHNKKIATFQTQITGRQRTTADKITQLITDNKRLVNTATNLQSTISTLQKQLQQKSRQNEILSTQITINKREFIQEVTKLKDQLSTISSVTKNQFDRMKIQNLKLSEQNRSLLFLVGEKEREIHKKGEAIKTFEEYREKINTLNIGDKEKRKIQSVSEQNPQQIGTKVLMINNFSNWLFEWNKIKNWTNKKTLLNLILDKEQIRGSALQSMGYLINVIHQCMLQSKNLEIQERCTILLAYFVDHGILRNQNLYVAKIMPIVVRGFRPIIQGQQQQKCRILNESTLKITSTLSKTDSKWSHEMTNEMLSVNGLKYIFNTIRKAQLDELVQQAYNVLIMIARNNEMISFMMSYDLNTLIFTNLSTQYNFVVFLVRLVKCLLTGSDYLKATGNSVLEYRKLFELLAGDDDEQLLELTLDCLLLLMQKTTMFTKSLQKLKSLSILSLLLRKNNDESTETLLKSAGKAYINIITQLQQQNINRYTKTELQKILEIVKLKKFNQFRFVRIMKVLVELVAIVTDAAELDQRVFGAVGKLYESYQVLEQDVRVNLNEIVNTIYQRNKQLLNKYSNDTLISQLVQSYKLSSHHPQLQFLLKILIFQSQQKRTTQILRSGRESLLSKLLNDALVADYTIAISALKLLLLLAKEKYTEKFINQIIMNGIVRKVLNQRGEEEYIGITLSLLYFLCKVEGIVGLALEAGIVGKVCNVIVERHDKQQIIFKALAVLQVCHTLSYKKKILNHLISSDNSLQILKTLNFSLRKAKNKVQIGTRAVFIYDFFNNPTSVESLAILAQRNQWLIEDLIMLRNQFIGKVDSMVYKVEMLLHQMSQKSNKVKKLYQRFKVEAGESDED